MKKKRRKRFVLVSILVFLLAVVFYRILIFKQEERKKRVLKVGFYDNYPYFYINDKAKVCGDYNEIVKSLQKKD